MRIGVPRETKDGERRVALTPAGAGVLAADGHVVIVEANAGAGSGFSDDEYGAAGATLVPDPAAVWPCDLIVKVKELQPPEFPLLVPHTTIFGFAQLGRDRRLLDAVLGAGVRIIAFETVRAADGTLPLLAPMSRIAGRLAPFAGAFALGTDRGGAGVLLPAVDDVPGARVVVIGAGSAGGAAAYVAAALGCRVTVLSRGGVRLARVAAALRAFPAVATHILDALGADGFAATLADADLVIGAILESGRLSPKLITRAHFRSMRPGSAFVDVGIDQGGIAATSRMTSLSAPTYVEEGIVHYAVPNMPALVARTATLALAAATLPYIRRLAQSGVAHALARDPALGGALMVWEGAVTDARLAADTGHAVAARPSLASRGRIA